MILCRKITCPACKVYLDAEKFHEIENISLYGFPDMDHIYICPMCGILFAVDSRIKLNGDQR